MRYLVLLLIDIVFCLIRIFFRKAGVDDQNEKTLKSPAEPFKVDDKPSQGCGPANNV